VKILMVLPILIPLATALLSLFAWKHRFVQRILAVIGVLCLTGAACILIRSIYQNGIYAIQIGHWPAPMGITLVADLFGAVMVLLAALTGLAVVFYSLASIDQEREKYGYYPLVHFLLMGVCGAFLTGDLFNLYVWFEVLLTASFVLMTLGGERAQLQGAMKYVMLNLISSALFLAAVGILYGLTGTLNMADLSIKIQMVSSSGLVTTCAMLFLIAFGIKAAIFPLFFWLPASYHTPPVAVSALFAGLLTKVGVYALIRVFTLLFIGETGFTHRLILAISGLTMITGVLGAVAQNEFRRILSFHIISQIGYMIMGLGLYTPLGLAGSIFYIIHHIIVKTNLFLVSGVAWRVYGTFDLKKLGGMYAHFPLVAFLFLIPALSLAGVPPLSGFFAKLSLLKAGLEVQNYSIVAIALGVGLLTLFSMTKIWNEVFWKSAPQKNALRPKIAGLLFPIILLALLTVGIGFGAETVFDFSQRAAKQLLNPAAYQSAVFVL
jgi:multicomponent Na+:H+ antiporter subunit D